MEWYAKSGALNTHESSLSNRRRIKRGGEYGLWQLRQTTYVYVVTFQVGDIFPGFSKRVLIPSAKNIFFKLGYSLDSQLCSPLRLLRIFRERRPPTSAFPGRISVCRSLPPQRRFFLKYARVKLLVGGGSSSACLYSIRCGSRKGAYSKPFDTYFQFHEGIFKSIRLLSLL